MKKIGVTFTALTEENLNKIKAIAPNYQVVQLAHHDKEILDCEVIFGGIATDLVKEARALKWIHTSFAGVDSLLAPHVKFPEDVILTNSAGTYGIAISEYLLTTTLMLMRRNLQYAKQQFENTWQPLGAVKSIYGSKICVVGLGDIGENYAKRCKALGATVVGVVRTKRKTNPTSVDDLYTIDELEQAIKDADVVALSLPGTPATTGLINANILAKIKKGALILNVGRGSAIDQDALIDALTSGHIGGAGLDVTSPEPLPSDSPLWQIDNVIITPHISGNQTLALTNQLITDKFIKYLKDYIAGDPFEKVVDKQLGY